MKSRILLAVCVAIAAAVALLLTTVPWGSLLDRPNTDVSEREVRQVLQRRGITVPDSFTLLHGYRYSQFTGADGYTARFTASPERFTDYRSIFTDADRDEAPLTPPTSTECERWVRPSPTDSSKWIEYGLACPVEEILSSFTPNRSVDRGQSILIVRTTTSADLYVSVSGN